MAKFVFSMNVSLDGYVDHDKLGPPDPALFRYFIDKVGALTGSVYGARIYEIMRYWDDEQEGWDADDREFAAVWRRMPKWVVSRTQKSLGPNATLITGDVEAAVRKLRAEQAGEIDIAGPVLAKSFTDWGLIDAYELHLHPVVLGAGNPYFAAARPRLRLAGSEALHGVMQLTYVPA